MPTLEELANISKHLSLVEKIVPYLHGRKFTKEEKAIPFVPFELLKHRLEFVLENEGIKYVNDSKATNVNSTWYALEATEGPIIWIAGGVDKENDYEILSDNVKRKVKGIILLGKDNQKIEEFFKKSVDGICYVDNMNDAIKIASENSEKGYAVVLSPACASFDLFENYEDRGDQFKSAVLAL